MNSMFYRQSELLVKAILEHPDYYNWSLQGLGMLRLYLATDLRLHVWDSRFAFPGASPIHNHPWNFDSYVVKGTIRQERFHEVTEGGEVFNYSTLQCGPGGCLVTEPQKIWLARGITEIYGPRQIYSQTANEIHWSQPDDGTVTLVHRIFNREDVDHANIYWPENEEWGSAEPRPATREEVREMCENAVRKGWPVSHGTN
jgi:hypothetical protein